LKLFKASRHIQMVDGILCPMKCKRLHMAYLHDILCSKLELVLVMAMLALALVGTAQ
jgi:hypothetical protein